MDDIKPILLAQDKRIVLEHTQGPMKGVHSICGLQSACVDPLPEICDAVEMIDAPSMRIPGPVSLVAIKPRYVLYRQFTPEMQHGMSFNKEQQ